MTAKMSELHSAIYQGTVRHRRYSPKYHDFTYQVFMVYLDLHEVDQVLSQSYWWSTRWFSPARFCRSDFFDNNNEIPLYDAVANKVAHETGTPLNGPIRMLTNLRYFGFIINPITCYYCFDKTGDVLEVVVAEVTNTPWRQRCHYILDFRNQDHANIQSNKQKMQFSKSMHVSPFQPMNLEYCWRGKKTTNNLLIHLDVYDHSVASANKPVFDATLNLQHQPMKENVMSRIVWRYPWMTFKVFAAIYWQAIKLWVKKIPFYSNPKSNSTVG